MKLLSPFGGSAVVVNAINAAATSWPVWLELVNKGNYCLAEPEKIYAVYLPHGGDVTIKVQPNHYRAQWFSALS
ncbi:MAG TPA: hypothetical protein VGS27_27160 [Candidatus Sulfotelmatobacter sp.]|nr:hypothetical protein [Candidatus Sulfotelmatobacter sp.]